MKKLIALFVLLTTLAVMATACSTPQDQVNPAGGSINGSFVDIVQIPNL